MFTNASIKRHYSVELFRVDIDYEITFQFAFHVLNFNSQSDITQKMKILRTEEKHFKYDNILFYSNIIKYIQL